MIKVTLLEEPNTIGIGPKSRIPPNGRAGVELGVSGKAEESAGPVKENNAKEIPPKRRRLPRNRNRPPKRFVEEKTGITRNS